MSIIVSPVVFLPSPRLRYSVRKVHAFCGMFGGLDMDFRFAGRGSVVMEVSGLGAREIAIRVQDDAYTRCSVSLSNCVLEMSVRGGRAAWKKGLPLPST